MRVRGIPSIRSSVTNLIRKICLNFQEIPNWQKSLVYSTIQIPNGQFCIFSNVTSYQYHEIEIYFAIKVGNTVWKGTNLRSLCPWVKLLNDCHSLLRKVSCCDKPKNLQKMQKCLTRQKWNLVRSAACFCLNLHEKCHF